jgi:hypothetical protein
LVLEHRTQAVAERIGETRFTGIPHGDGQDKLLIGTLMRATTLKSKGTMVLLQLLYQ